MSAGSTYSICWVGSHGQEGGDYPSVGQLLAPRFEADGHEVILVSRRRGKLAKAWDIFSTLTRRRSEYEIVVVDVFSTSAFRYAQLAARIARRLRKRLILVLHGGGLPGLARRRPSRVARLLAAADAVVSPSSYLAREVGDVLEQEVEVLGNPVDAQLFVGRARTECRPRMLWVRSFRDMYRPDLAARVVAELVSRGVDIHLTMAGPEHDGTLSECQSLASELDVADRIAFPGLCSREEIARLTRESDLFLNTTSVDNTPLSVIEALAAGLCIVSTAVGGLPDLLTHDQDALLVPEGDTDTMIVGFVDAVERLLKSAELTHRLSGAALVTAQQYEMGDVSRAWYELFDRVRRGRGPIGSKGASLCS